MALFRKLLAFALAGKLLSTRQVMIVVLSALFIELSATSVLAYDNNVLPPFEADKQGRGYNSVSIHPDGERWLISECMETPGGGQRRCELYLYNLRTHFYQRFQLSPGYSYTSAKFSPSGQWIVAVRRPVFQSDDYEGKVNSLKQSEIFMIKPDGSDFRICAIREGHLKLPSLSPDESKIAYWESAIIRPPGEKTAFASFDVYEHDLRTGMSVRFAGTHRFFQAHGLQYLDNNQIIASASGPARYAANIYPYLIQFNFSEVYLLERGQARLPDPAYTGPRHARAVTLDQSQSVFLLGEHKKHGLSLFRFNQQPAHWRIPRLIPGGISALIASPDGSYVGFIYPVNLPRSGNPTNGLGIFNLSTERWIPLDLPLPASAEPIPSL